MVLEDLRRHSNEDTSCKICGSGEREDLSHFIIRCRKLDWFRNKDLVGEGGDKEVLGRLLFTNENKEEVKAMLEKMWRERSYWMRTRELRQ